MSNTKISSRYERKFSCFRLARISRNLRKFSSAAVGLPAAIEEGEDGLREVSPDGTGLTYVELTTSTCASPSRRICALLPVSLQSQINKSVPPRVACVDRLLSGANILRRNAVNTRADYYQPTNRCARAVSVTLNT